MARREQTLAAGARPEFLEHFRAVAAADGTACARALASGERVAVEDVERDPSFAPHRRIAAAAGFRAVQSTVLKARSGHVLGMLSTHFREPRRLSDRDANLVDLFAGHAASDPGVREYARTVMDRQLGPRSRTFSSSTSGFDHHLTKPVDAATPRQAARGRGRAAGATARGLSVQARTGRGGEPGIQPLAG